MGRREGVVGGWIGGGVEEGGGGGGAIQSWRLAEYAMKRG